MKTSNLMTVSPVLIAGVLLSGCSVVMASKHRGVEVAEIMNCQVEACFLALRDTEVLTTDDTEEGKSVTYRSLKKQGSSGRAVMHGLLDVATLGIWEVAGTPIESSKKKERFYIYTVAYDFDGGVVKATIDAAT